MILLSFQSKDVLREIHKGSYKANTKYSREKRSYEKDIAQLNGEVPIWGFEYGPNKEYHALLNGSLIERYRCEMSINSKSILEDMVLLELEIDDESVKTGLTHNACETAKVFPVIHKYNLKAVYSLSFAYHWYYPYNSFRDLL